MYNRILGPLDGSKLSECSLEHIKSIATGCHVSEVILLMVLEPVVPPFSETATKQAIEEMAKRWREAEKQSKQKVESYLAKVADSLKKEGVAVQTVAAPAKTGQSAAEIILDFADNNNVDLIIMSTHGRSGVSRWAFGSVTDRVVRHAKSPVLTISPPGCRAS
jgi:nucleotide-binding universal stress UspA family protein